MEQTQIATLLYTIVLGLLVLWTYGLFLGGLEEKQRTEAWAVFGRSRSLFVVWCISAGMAAVGFLVFIASYLLMANDGSALFALTWVPVSFFLGLSALYAPLLYFGHRALVIATLVGVAAATVALAGFAYALFGPAHPAFGLTVLLAGHCTVMDAAVWGCSWYGVGEA